MGIRASNFYRMLPRSDLGYFQALGPMTLFPALPSWGGVWISRPCQQVDVCGFSEGELFFDKSSSWAFSLELRFRGGGALGFFWW